MIDKRYENKKDIKYEQLNEYLKKEKVDEDDNWEDFDKDDKIFHEKDEKIRDDIKEDVENESK